MFQRGVSIDDVRSIVFSGEVIEAYPEDTPYASRLILGFSGTRPLHIVAADNNADNETIIITVYEPDPALWNSDFKRRKTK